MNIFDFSRPMAFQCCRIDYNCSEFDFFHSTDLILQSKSGTGKTLVFCTIILERYNPEIKAPQSLIVVPTREIALQVEGYLNSIGSSCKGKVKWTHSASDSDIVIANIFFVQIDLTT